MGQSDLADFGKFALAFCGYFIGTGLVGMIIAKGDSDVIPTVGWFIGGLAFASLMILV